MAGLRLNGVTLVEEGAARPLLDSVTLEVAPGELAMLVGASGAGKSTLLEIAAGWRTPTHGDVLLGGSIAIAPQAPERLFFETTVEDEIAFALGNTLPAESRRQRVIEALRGVGLDEAYLERHPLALSGGEQRLVALAAVTVASPAVLLLDEPAAGLAAALEERVVARLRTLADAGAAVLVATHEVEAMAGAVDRVIALHDGAVVANGPPDEVFASSEVARLASLSVPVPLRYAVAAPPPRTSARAAEPHSIGSAPARAPSRRVRVAPPGVAGGMLAALLLALAFFLPAPLWALAALALVAVPVAALTGADLRRAARLLAPLALLATFATAGHLLTADGGRPLLSAGPLEVTTGGLDAAARTWLRIIGPVLAGTAVTAARPPSEVARGLRRLLAALPLARRLAADTGLAVLLVIRLAPLMRGEVRRIDRAQRSRGSVAGRRRSRVRAWMSLGVPALTGTMLRAERLALAIELRGWAGSLPARGPILNAIDLVWVVAAAGTFAAVALLA